MLDEGLYAAPTLQQVPQDAASKLSRLQQAEIQRVFSCRSNAKAVLQVSDQTSQEDIERSYKRLSLLLHPDKNKHEGAEETFKVISKAYLTLSERATEANSRRKEWSAKDVFESFYPGGYPSGTLNDEAVLLDLASKIGPEWYELGTRLGIDPDFLENLTGSGAHQALPLRMLHCWMRQYPDNQEQKKRILEALDRCPNITDREDLSDLISKYEDTCVNLFPTIANKLTNCWEQFGLRLGLHQDDLNGLKFTAERPDEAKAKFQMLIHWKNTREKDDADILLPLQQAGRQDLVTWLVDRCGLVPIRSIQSQELASPRCITEPNYSPTSHATSAEDQDTDFTVAKSTSCPKCEITARQLREEEDEKLLLGIREHCQSLDRNILRISQLDLIDEVHDIKPYLMTLQMNINTDGQRKKLFDIPEGAIFSDFNGDPAPSTVLLSGAVGQGKSTFIKSYIYNWCKSQLTGQTRKEMMVFIPATTITGDVWACVEANILCKTRERRELVSSFVKSDCEDVFIFIDGIDEVRDKVAINRIRTFVQECKNHGVPHVFVSTRDNLAGVELIHFNRHLQIQGFSVEQGLEYVKKYLGEDSALLQQLKKNRNKREINNILINPLRLQILCIVTKQNMLQIEELSNLRITHLYECMNNLLIMREHKKFKPCVVNQSENSHFYKMCLYSMLRKKASFTEQLLSSFYIDETCPIIRLLNKTCSDISWMFIDRYVYSPPHESYLEYWCAKGIMSLDPDIRKLILLYLCSQMDWNNVQLMTYGVLTLQDQNAETQLSELSTIIRYLMVMLPDRNSLDVPMSILRQDPRYMSLKQAGDDLISMIEAMTTETGKGGRDMLQLLLLDQAGQEELITRVHQLHEDIDYHFDMDYQYMRDRAWFTAIHPHHCSNNPIGAHIHRCLEQSLPDQLAHVTESTLGKMLPCRDEYGWMTYRVEHTPRWGQIFTEDPRIHAWCPKDGAYLLHQMMSTLDQDSQPPTASHTHPHHRWEEVDFYCDWYRYELGYQPESAFSQS